jgi:MarR-like DNA-binding transcriptional regulator SgrR of sgrS sRNA
MKRSAERLAENSHRCVLLRRFSRWHLQRPSTKLVSAYLVPISCFRYRAEADLALTAALNLLIAGDHIGDWFRSDSEPVA